MQRIFLYGWYSIIALIVVVLVVSPITTAVIQVVKRVASRNAPTSNVSPILQDDIIPRTSSVDDEPIVVAPVYAYTLASGRNHLCAVTQSAHVRCWGDNHAGQIGSGSDGVVLPYATTPMQVSGIVDVASIALGDAHSCAVRQRTGTVWCWGDNQFSQLGNNTVGPQTQQSIPQPVSDIRDVVQLSAGANHTCAVLSNGSITCWGDNRYAQMARPDDAYATRPVSIVLPLPAQYVMASGNSTCAVLNDSSVWCWGANAAGLFPSSEALLLAPIKLDIPAPTAMVALSDKELCGLTASGSVWCRSSAGVRTLQLPAISRMRAFGTHGTCAVSTDAHIWCWNEDAPARDMALYGGVDVALGEAHLCVLLRAAKAVCQGDNRLAQLATSTTATTRRESFAVVNLGHTGGVMSGGQAHMCALWQQGLVRCWGRNLEGQVGAPEQRDTPIPVTPDINGVTRVVTGGNHTCVTRYDRHVYCWGANEYGQLGIATLQRASQPQQVWSLNSVVAVTAGLNHTCALADAGDVWCWGDNRFHQISEHESQYSLPTRIDNVPAVVTLAAGGNTNCALQYDGQVVCWGEAISTEQRDFMPIPLLADVIDVQVGWQFACALQNTGQLWCWGHRDPTIAAHTAQLPHQVTGFPPLLAFAVGGSHVCGIDNLHQLWCVGDNQHGQVDATSNTAQLTTPQRILDGVSHVALGFATSCARLQIGQTMCWGEASYGQLGTGAYTYDATNRFVVDLNDGFEIASGGNFSCALLTYVATRCWGGNEYGQLGDGTTNTSSIPQVVRSNDEYVAIATGNAHACAIVSDGTVRCWGHNNYGQLGNEATEDSSTPVIAAVQSVVGLSLGQSHSCALLQDGGGACWGKNDDGQLGSGNTAASGMPLRVADLINAIEIKTGGNHTCALLQDTTVKCWGRNQQAQLGIGDTGPGLSIPVVVPGLSDIVHISLGLDHSCAVNSAGALYCWGWNRYGQVGMGTVGDDAYVVRPQLVADVANVAQVSAGDNHTCVLQRNGEVRCWGDNYSGQLGISDRRGATASTTTAALVAGLNNVVAIAAGGAHTCALLQRGDVACWGWNEAGQIGNGSGGFSRDVDTPRPVVGRLGAVSLAVSSQHVCMVDDVGTVWCWGDNTFGQLGIGSELGSATRTLPSEVDAAANTVAVSLGADHTCALLVTNDLNCWGRNTVGQLGNSFSGELADSPVPYFVGNFVGVTAFAAGGNQSCAIIATQVFCWGDNQYGQIATEPTGVGEFRTTPTLIQNIDPARDLVIGATHVCALLESAQVNCWGRNNQHQLGFAGQEMSAFPVLVPDVQDVVAFAAGDNHTCAVQRDGHVWCWGSNQYGQLGVVGSDITTPQQVPNISDALAVAAGRAHTCVLTRQRGIVCWGDNTHLQRGDQDASTQIFTTIQLDDVPTAIAAGGDRTCVIATSTAIWCWGQNTHNLLGVTANPDREMPVFVQQLWEMRVKNIPLQTPTPFPTLVVRRATNTPQPTRMVQPTATLIKRIMPTPAFQRIPYHDN